MNTKFYQSFSVRHSGTTLNCIEIGKSRKHKGNDDAENRFWSLTYLLSSLLDPEKAVLATFSDSENRKDFN